MKSQNTFSRFFRALSILAAAAALAGAAHGGRAETHRLKQLHASAPLSMKQPQPHVTSIGPDGRLICSLGSADSFRTTAASAVGEVEVRKFGSHLQDRFVLELQGFTPQAAEAMSRAVQIMSQYFNIDGDVPVRISANFEDLGAGSTLAAARPTFIVLEQFSADLNPIRLWLPIGLSNHLRGMDSAPGESDIEISVNSAVSGQLYFGTDGNPPPGQIDAVTVFMHEIIHGMGFTTSLSVENGLGHWGDETESGTPPGVFGHIYDFFITTGEQQDLIEPTGGPAEGGPTGSAAFPNASEELAAVLTGNDLFFFGFDAIIANNTQNVAIHAPPEFSQGSSITHTEEATFFDPSPGGLMSPAIAPGEGRPDPGAVILAMLRDMGWSTLDLQHFALFGDGNNIFSSDIVIVNLSQDEEFGHVEGEVLFFDADTGAPLDPTPFLEPGTSTLLSLNPGATTTLRTINAQALTTGSVVVSTTGPVSAVIRFFLRLQNTGIAGVSSARPVRSAAVPVRRSGDLNSGVAIRNTGFEEIQVELRLINANGAPVPGGAAQQIISLPGQAIDSRFINEFFPGVNTSNFTGTVAVRALTGRIAVIALELEVGLAITTLPVEEMRE
jgi:hypothetical protein